MAAIRCTFVFSQNSRQLYKWSPGAWQTWAKQAHADRTVCRWEGTCCWCSIFSCSWLSSFRLHSNTRWLRNSLAGLLTGCPARHCEHPSIHPKSHLKYSQRSLLASQNLFILGTFPLEAYLIPNIREQQFSFVLPFIPDGI